MNIKDYIYDVPNFPKEGIVFKDITPICDNGEAFKYVTKELAKFAKSCGATHIVSPESRGFIFGCPVSTELGIGFVPVRKPGKLPTLKAAINLAEKLGAEVVGVACVIELLGLGGKDVVKGYNYKCLIEDTEEM